MERSAAEWHVAVGDSTQGPYTLDELASCYAQGSVAPDTLIYRDGAADWQPAAQVNALLQRVTERSMRASFAPSAGGRRLGASAVSMGSDPFGERLGSTPRLSAEEMFSRGEGHEGTVQFSLSQMRALSSVSSPSMVPTKVGRAVGQSATNDSGLIDVRSLAQAPALAAPAKRDGYSPMSSLSPMSMPIMRQSSGIDRKTALLAGASAFGFITAAAVGVLALTRSQTPNAISAPVAAASSAPTAAPVVMLNAVAIAPETAPVIEDEANDVAEETVQRSTRKRHGRRGYLRTSPAKRAESPKKATKATTDIDDVLANIDKPKTKASSSSSIDDLLDNAVNAKKAAPKAAPAADSGLPMTPARDQMLAALTKAKGKAAKCKGPGVATADITIAGDSGRASNVSVAGVDGAAKSCVEKAVRSTAFPKFQKPTFGVKFPFKLGN